VVHTGSAFLVSPRQHHPPQWGSTRPSPLKEQHLQTPARTDPKWTTSGL